MLQLSNKHVQDFQETVWGYYRQHGRQMPWREDPTPYKVLVSELMLQQTQVSRVIPKYNAFLYTCPNIAQLADKPLRDVLVLWSGLGYNRRAQFLHRAAQKVVSGFSGIIPDTFDDLVSLPGVGKNTAGAILAYAYNQPVVFIETNIRTVLFHHFYADNTGVISDDELELLVDRTLDRENPREWYWALMDYGSHLKKTAGGRLTSSKHYVKQAPLKGSLREMRGRIIKCLVSGQQSKKQLRTSTKGDERFDPALLSLKAEGLVSVEGEKVSLTGEGETP